MLVGHVQRRAEPAGLPSLRPPAQLSRRRLEGSSRLCSRPHELHRFDPFFRVFGNGDESLGIGLGEADDLFVE